MEVLKKGNKIGDPMYKFKCDHCGAKLKASLNEAETMHCEDRQWVYHFECPCCKRTIQIGERDMKEA